MSDQSNISIPIDNSPTTADLLTSTEPVAGDSMEGVESSAPDASDSPADAPGTNDDADAPAATTTPAPEASMAPPPALMEEDAPEPTKPEPEPSPAKITYIDYLRSPIVTLDVTTPATDSTAESITVLSAHLALLQTSPYLSRVCAPFSHSTPADERTISLPGHTLTTIGAFLEYLYTGEYTPRLVPGLKPDEMVLEELEGATSDTDDAGDELLKHARIYTLAEQLEMPLLKELAHSKIHRINSTAKGELRYARYVYKHTTKEDRTIRQPIASFWAHRSHVLRHSAEDDFRRMILEFPQFAYDILSIVLDQKERGKESRRAAQSAAGEDYNPSTPAEKVPRTNRKRARTSTVVG